MRARRVLSEVVSILNSAQIPFWLTSGTLLGWFREGDFISNDPDIDLGIHLSDYSHLLPSLFQNAGFRLGFRGTQKEGMELSVAKGVKIPNIAFHQFAGSQFHKGRGKLSVNGVPRDVWERTQEALWTELEGTEDSRREPCP
ncbi:LicD family protein [bacterium]|nr:LicD family protein [bacterium]